MYYVYVLCNSRGNLYVGYSGDLRRRIREHTRGGSRSTSGDRWKLVYYEAYLSKGDAVERERKLKQRGQAKRFLRERIKGSISCGCIELSAR